MRKRLVAGAAAIALSALTLVGPAGADPTNAKNARIIELDCDSGLGSVDIVVNGNGNWSPGHVVSNNQVIVPREFHNVITVTPTGGEAQVFFEDFVKPSPRNGRLATCTYTESFSDEFVSFLLEGTVLVSYTPAR